MSKLVNKIVAVATIATAVMVPSFAFAQTAAVVCPDYKKPPTNIPSERTGKKVQKAFEAYNNDQVEEALNLLYEIDTSQTFDRAFTDRFIGNLLATKEGSAPKALDYLLKAVKPNVLNDTEQASTMRLIADLSMQEKQYDNAISYYQQWMDYTCKQDPDIYTRITQAYYETKQLDKMVSPADKAIKLYEKPNKNPYLLKMTSFYERKMYPETIKVAEELVRLFPDNKSYWTQLGFFYMLVEDYKKALSTFEMAYDQGYLTKSSEIKALAQLYATNSIPYKSAVIQEKYLKEGLIKREESSLSALANTWHQAKNLVKAADYYGQAAELSGDADHYRKQGILLLAAEKYKEAKKVLNIALEKSTEDLGRIHMALMEASFYTGDYKAAYAHVLEAKQDKSTARSARSWEPYIKEKAKNRGIKL